MTEFLSQFMDLFSLPGNISLTGLEWLVHPVTSLLYASAVITYAFFEWRRSKPVKILINDVITLERQLASKPINELLQEDNFAEQSLIRPAWRAFKDSAHIKSQYSHQAKNIWLFTPPAAFFNSTMLDAAPVDLKRLRATPDKLIGIGLLLTFLTLVMALAFVSKKASGDVNTLTVLLMLTAGTKFLISIAGLGSAIIFRSQLAKLETLLRDRLANVCNHLQQQTTLYTQEHLLVQLIETSKQQAQHFEKSSAQVAHHISDAVATMATTVTNSISDEIMKKLETRLEQVLNHTEQRVSAICPTIT